MRSRPVLLVLGIFLFITETLLAEEVLVSAFQANVRDGPGRSAAILTTLNRGAVLEVLGRRGSWYKVRVRDTGLEGYVHDSMLGPASSPLPASPLPGAPPLPGATPAARGLEVRSLANLRAGPGPSSQILATLPRGKLLEMVAASGSWYKVRTPEGREGFVHSSTVRFAELPVASASPAAEPVPEPREAPPPPRPSQATLPRPETHRESAPTAAPAAVETELAAEPMWGARAFGEAGFVSFRAKDSFNAVFGGSRGGSYGLGAEFRYQRFFLQANLERTRKTGERVLVFEDQIYPLGVPATVTITPLSFVAGYRFGPFRRITALAGLGVGSYGLKEESAFASSTDNVDERFTSFHLLAGAEYAATRWLAVRVEAQYVSVPDALGAGGVSASFGETNLGGFGLRLKILAGR
jgi:opacity protein-like surface antigen/SH3-like domain-containing protein